MNDESGAYLVCVECGRETNTRVDDIYDQFSKTKRGTHRKRTARLSTLSKLVCNWRCDSCLDFLERELSDP